MRVPRFGGRTSSFLKFLLLLLIVSFVLQTIVEAVVDKDAYYSFFLWTGFTPEGFLSGKLWTLISYACLHEGPWHLVLNLLAVFFMGRALEEDLGSKMMTWLTLFGAASGALLWFLFNMDGAGGLVGASAIAMAYVTTFCLRRPEQPITLLLFFVIPCTLKPKWILWALLGIESYGFLFTELNGLTAGVAHSAHLGGMLAGLFFFGYVRSGGIASGKRPRLQKPSWPKVSNQSRKPGAPAGYSVNLDDREMVEQEVDRILDKINEKGFGSLSEDEKITLDKAKSLLGK
jgi:membrane associated rhomboid family serine protease